MSTSAHKLPIAAAEYLEGELRSEIRHEFMDGRVYAVSDDNRRHNEVCGDLICALKNHFRVRDTGILPAAKAPIHALSVKVRIDSIGYAAPLASFYQSNPFPQDVKRPWYHLNRIED